MGPEVSGGWSAYEKLVLARLDALDEGMAAIEAQQVLTRIDVAQLKVKAGLWGAAAGLIPAIFGVVAVLIGGGSSA